MLIAKEYGRTLIGIGTVYALAQAAWGDDDDYSLTFDWRHTDFGKIRLGNTRIDPLFGFAQAIRMTGRTFTFTSVGADGIARPTRAADFGRFIRSSFSPVIGTPLDVFTGSNVVGEKVTLGSAALGLVTPLSFGDMLKVMEDQGVPRGTALTLLSVMGAGIQVYSPRKRKHKKKLPYLAPTS